MVQQVHHKVRLGLFITSAVVFLLPFLAGAQSLDGSIGNMNGDAFSVSVNPQYPAPYEQATVSLLSGSVDLANAIITAVVGGKEIYKGSARPFSIKLGKAGSVTGVKVTVSYGGTNYNQELSIQPQDVVLVAEPLSSSPPLYPGKPHVPLEGSVRVVAIANLKDAGGKTSSPSTYSYSWTVDGMQIANSSGIGKSTVIVASPLQYRVREVSVVVTNVLGGLVGGAELSLTAVEPSMRVYENDSLLGIRYERAISGSFAINSAETTLYAAPFSLPTTNGAPSVQWFLNGSPAQAGNFITLRPTGSGRGNASLSVTSSAGDYARTAAELSISFGDAAAANFFGL
ncbi:hypothetical protein HY412_02090 [Candidatus Kaiserbacteria bacterium]|nr:hypothetical protein [Candidatus Kaiserbacteria bacterium]